MKPQPPSGLVSWDKMIEHHLSEVGIAGLHSVSPSEYTTVMERNLKEVLREAAQLPERDRATLAGLLIETLDPVSEPDVEAAQSEELSEEIKRRLAEIEAGTVELIPWEEVRAELFSQSNESLNAQS